MSMVKEVKTFTANGALVKGRRVKITAGTATDPPQVEYAGAGEQGIGVVERDTATTALVPVRLHGYGGTLEISAAKAIARGATVYGAASGQISDAAVGTAVGIAAEAATALNDIIEVVPFTVISTTAATVSIADAGGFTAQATTEAALQEVYQHILSTQGIIPLPLGSWFEADGTALAVFADGASSTPGFNLADSEALNIRWNNHANPDPIGTTVPIPPDFDNTANATVHILASKSGATLADAVTFDVTAFNIVPAALHDADADFGGATGAMTGDAAAKTVAELTRTLALANLVAAPGAIALTIQPTDGTLGTDDVMVHAVWIEYKRKILTS